MAHSTTQATVLKLNYCFRKTELVDSKHFQGLAVWCCSQHVRALLQ